MNYPRVRWIRQDLEPHEPIDVDAALDHEFEVSGILAEIEPGSRVVIAAGSRGIPNYAQAIRHTVARIRERGADVAIMPAMGSHGGAEAAGQVQILADLGITEAGVDAPVIDTMQVGPVGTTPLGIPVYADRSLVECDHIIVVNRIKEHTEFSGSVESGLSKMMAIGFGRAAGAVATHRHAVASGYEAAIRDVAKYCLDRLPVLAGIGLLDTADGGTAKVAVVPAARIPSEEPRLLEESRRLKPKLPLDQVDLLVVDEMGKDISGTGIDTKVIGRVMNVYEPEPEHPSITRIFVRDLTPGTHGNALGIGLADFTSRKLADKVDWHATNINCVTAVTPEKARLPMTFETEREAFDAALRTIGPKLGEEVRLLWIRNTTDLVELLASEAAIGAMDRGRVQPIGGFSPITFGEDGGLQPVPAPH
jgi:hypothetical protein